MRVALAGLRLTTAVRMVNRVHGGAANGRAYTAPTLGTGLAQLLQAVLVVADFAHRGAAFNLHLAHFTGTQAKGRETLLASDQLHAGTGGAGDLSTLAR